jgi:trans-2,3-dihydro-3-hydroxyanthranilate isomerase
VSVAERLAYEVVDVFTDRPYGGNPLAVVLDADRLGGDGDAGDDGRVPPVRDGVRAAAGERRRVGGPAPRTAGCGLAFPYLAVRPEAMARAANRRAPGVSHVAVFAWDADTRTAHLRAFLPGFRVAEDPASGSAVLGLGVWLVGSGLLPGDGTSAYRVRQGAEIGRPSMLDGAVTARGGAVTGVRLGGGVRAVAAGTILAPGQSTRPD